MQFHEAWAPAEASTWPALPCPMQVTLGDYPVVSPWRPLCTRTELMGATSFMVRRLRQMALPLVHG